MEWHSVSNNVFDSYHKRVCTVSTPEHAELIVREHNTHAPMIAMIEKSIAITCKRCPGSENCTSANDCNTIKELKETLALAKGE